MEDLLTDLEKRLNSHTGEALRSTLRTQIDRAEARLNNLVAAGMAPKAFAQAQACVLALNTADDLLLTLVVSAEAGGHPLISPLLQATALPYQQAAVHPQLPH